MYFMEGNLICMNHNHHSSDYSQFTIRFMICKEKQHSPVGLTLYKYITNLFDNYLMYLDFLKMNY
jgi:hypothetical protein